MKDKNAWLSYDEKQEKELEKLCGEYREFLNKGKTERECVGLIRKAAEKAGYKDIKEIMKEGGKVSAGDKVYAVNMGKMVTMFNIGTDPIENGMNILGAHIDSPRLDVKQNPLYDDTDIAYFDTHYYGGIKKYQWVTIPMAIHGVVVKEDGTSVDISIGEADDDPVVFVSDLLIHLAADQMDKKARLVIEGDALDIVVGSRPLSDKEKEGTKARIVKLLEKNYGISENDLWSAELEIVPAGKARDAGLDRSMIMSYGQDDRVCAYTSLAAMLDVESVKRTSCTLLVDKEEIGSVGATGMQSRFFENTVAELLDLMGAFSELAVRRTLAHSTMLSSDVSAAYDPIYASKFDKKNAAVIGYGMVFNKFTGSRGKSGSNDANAEYLARLRKVLNSENVKFQSAELGKVDVGGGGTIAYIMSLYGMEVVDSGVAVLNMHAPYEVTGKSDIYETYKGYKAFLTKMDI